MFNHYILFFFEHSYIWRISYILVYLEFLFWRITFILIDSQQGMLTMLRQDTFVYGIPYESFDTSAAGLTHLTNDQIVFIKIERDRVFHGTCTDNARPTSRQSILSTPHLWSQPPHALNCSFCPQAFTLLTKCIGTTQSLRLSNKRTTIKRIEIDGKRMISLKDGEYSVGF